MQTTQDSGRSLRALKRLLIAYKKKLDRKNTRKHIEPETYESYDEDRPDTPTEIEPPINAPLIDLTKRASMKKKKNQAEEKITMPEPGLLYETIIAAKTVSEQNIENLTTDEFVEKMQQVLLNEDQTDVELVETPCEDTDVKPIFVDYCLQAPTPTMLKQLEAPAYLPAYKAKNPLHYKLYKNIYVRQFAHVTAASKKNCFKGLKVVDVKYHKYLANKALPLMDSVRQALTTTKDYFAEKLEQETMLEIEQTYKEDISAIDNQVFFAIRELQKPINKEKREERIIAEIEISDEEIEETITTVVKRKRGRPRKNPLQADSNLTRDESGKTNDSSEDMNSINYSNDSSACDSTAVDVLPEEGDFVGQLEFASTPYGRGRGCASASASASARGRVLTRGAAVRGRGVRGRGGRGSSAGGSEQENGTATATTTDSSDDEDNSCMRGGRGRGVSRGRGSRGRGRGRGRGKGRGGLNFFQREILTIQEKFKQEQGNPRKRKFKFPMPLKRPDSDQEDQGEHHNNFSDSDENDEIFTYGHKSLHIKPSALLLYHPDIPTIRVYDSDEEIDPDERPSSALSFLSNSSNEANNTAPYDSYCGQSVETENRNDTEYSTENEDGDEYSDDSSEESNADDYNAQEVEEHFKGLCCNSDLNTDEDSDDSDDEREDIAAFYRRLANDDGSSTQSNSPPPKKRDPNERYKRLLARREEEAAEKEKSNPLAKEKIVILENVLLNSKEAGEDLPTTSGASEEILNEEKVICQNKLKINNNKNNQQKMEELENEEIVKRANIPLRKFTIQIEPLPLITTITTTITTTTATTTTTPAAIMKTSKLKRPSIASKEQNSKEKKVKFSDEVTTTSTSTSTITTATTTTNTTTTDADLFLVPKAPPPMKPIKKVVRFKD